MEVRPTILIVDDDLNSLHNRTAMFAESGLAVREAASMNKAVELIGDQGDEIDLAIIDINLTGDPLDQSGIRLARLLRDRHPTVPVVAYSAYYSEDEVNPDLHTLFAEWVVKGSMSVRSLDEFVDRCQLLAQQHHRSRE